MKKARWKKIWKWTQLVALVYIIIGVAFYFLQDKMVFRPVKLSPDYQYSFDQPFKEEQLIVNEDRMISMVHFTVPDSVRKGIVLYFHGNRTNINRYATFARFFTRNGYEAWMIDYPGYGKSTGDRSEKILHEDALSFYKMAIARVPAEKIIIYGKSLGTGMATKLASVRDCQRLILETPFYSFPALAKRYMFLYPVGLLSKYEFANHRYISNVNAPISIFHGTSDWVVPYKQGKKLSALRPGTQFISIPGGSHNNLSGYEVYGRTIDSLLRK